VIGVISMSKKVTRLEFITHIFITRNKERAHTHDEAAAYHSNDAMRYLIFGRTQSVRLITHAANKHTLTHLRTDLLAAFLSPNSNAVGALVIFSPLERLISKINKA
jgi:hypothetical protein